MNFRKDELIIPDESEDDYDENEDDAYIVKNKIMHNIEEAYELVDMIEDKMNRVTNTIRGLDKRMSHNNRLLGSLVMFEGFSDEEDKEQQTPVLGIKQKNRVLYATSIADKKQKVIPKLKRMSQFAINKLNLTTDFDTQNIEAMKAKLAKVSFAANVNSRMQIMKKKSSPTEKLSSPERHDSGGV